MIKIYLENSLEDIKEKNLVCTEYFMNEKDCKMKYLGFNS